MTMLPEAIADWAHIKPDQMQHAVVEHPDGGLEDVWGKVPAAMIARRFGITAWRLSADAHQAMMADGIAERPEALDEVVEAERLIRGHLKA
ncbi:hypothetical protein [Rhizorhabdus argentea]|uniref:hypothetical protein n=1 Tax=Rhizorhabdus argentea TaxID=1387174 RepID=UPI0030EE9931